MAEQEEGGSCVGGAGRVQGLLQQTFGESAHALVVPVGRHGLLLSRRRDIKKQEMMFKVVNLERKYKTELIFA